MITIKMNEYLKNNLETSTIKQDERSHNKVQKDMTKALGVTQQLVWTIYCTKFEIQIKIFKIRPK